MGTATKGSDARLANRPFFVFDFRALALNHDRQSAQKSKTTKNGVESFFSFQLQMRSVSCSVNVNAETFGLVQLCWEH